MQTEMNIEKRRLSDLRPAEYNPRIELKPGDPEYENIRKSIEAFGYVDPIIINADGTIMGGAPKVQRSPGSRIHGSPGGCLRSFQR